MPEVIRVKTSHYLGVKDDSPKFELNIDENAKVDVEDSDEKIVVKSGDAKLVITKESWSMTYPVW